MDDGPPGRSGVVYRVDPRMFRDGDNDGVGDLMGLIAELDYVRLLGIDALWLASSPPFPRNGVASLATVPDALAASGASALFGLLAREAHRRGLHVLLTIDSDPEPGCGIHLRTTPRPRHRAEDGRPGRIATRTAAPAAPVRRWLDLGADAVWTGDGWQTMLGRSAPSMVAGLASPSVLFAADHHLVGCPACVVCADPAHCAPASSPPAPARRWDPRQLATAVAAARPATLEAAALWMLSDPGAARASRRLGADRARLAATLLLTLPGVSVLTAGDEVGVVDGVPGPDVGRRIGRGDQVVERAPMPWDEQPNGGFAPAPWGALVGGGTAPVARQRRDPDSLLSFHRRLIALRRSEPTLVRGAVSLVLAEDGLLGYLLEGPGSRIAVALNGGSERVRVPFLRGLASGHVALATDREREGLRVDATVALAPNEAMVIRFPT